MKYANSKNYAKIGLLRNEAVYKNVQCSKMELFRNGTVFKNEQRGERGITIFCLFAKTPKPHEIRDDANKFCEMQRKTRNYIKI